MVRPLFEHKSIMSMWNVQEVMWQSISKGSPFSFQELHQGQANRMRQSRCLFLYSGWGGKWLHRVVSDLCR